MSFFESLLGNAALSGEKVLGAQIEQNQALARADHASQLEIARQQTIDKNRQDMAEQQRQALAKRTSEQTQQAETGGRAIGDARDIGMLQRMQAGVSSGGTNTKTGAAFQGSPDASREELAAKLQDPAVRAIYEKAGYIKPGTALSGLDDQLTYSRTNGLHDAEVGLKAARDETVKALAAEATRLHQERRDNLGDDRLLESARKTDLQHSATMAAIASRNNGSGSGQEDSEKLTTRKQAALRAIANYDRAGVDKSDPDYQAEIDELRAVNKRLTKQGGDAPAAPAPLKGSPTLTAAKPASPTKEFTYDPKTRTFK